jgi:hypothetical protein
MKRNLADFKEETTLLEFFFWFFPEIADFKPGSRWLWRI